MGSLGPERSSSPTFFKLPQPLKGSPPSVIVFFSFLDHTSYLWATQKGVASNIRRSLPAGTEVHRYHVSSTDKSGWNFGQELTRAWAVAMHLHVDDKIIGPLFANVLINKTVIDVEGMRELFWREASIDKLRFDRAWVDPGVIANAKYQDELSANLSKDKLPEIVVGGTQAISGDEIQHMCEDDDFGLKVGNLVRDLVVKT
jgi:protein dithiol oxidoreductase (disulfide-forming)